MRSDIWVATECGEEEKDLCLLISFCLCNLTIKKIVFDFCLFALPAPKPLAVKGLFATSYLLF